MALPVTAKANELAKTLSEGLALRFGAMTTPFSVVSSTDSNGYPVLSINDGTPITNEVNIIIRVSPFDDGTTVDIFGNRGIPCSLHVIEMITETASTALTTDHVAQAYAEVFAKNAIVKIYQTTNGTVPTAALMTSGNLKSTISGRNTYWGTLATS